MIGSAEEVLKVLKSDAIRESTKRSEVEDLIGKLKDERFALLVNLAKKITDFDLTINDANDVSISFKTHFKTLLFKNDDIDETQGVPVRFDEDDDMEEEDMTTEVREDQDSDDEENQGEEANFEGTLQRDGGADEIEAETKDKKLRPVDVDAHWIQRSMAKIYDSNDAQEKTRKILDILRDAKDERACESALVILLGFNNFEIIKTLRDNYKMIYYCTKLKQASPEERLRIEEEIAQQPELHYILDQLRGVDAKGDVEMTDVEKREAKAHQRRLAESGSEGANFAQHRKVLDLDDLSFSQGSHLMSNKTCALPKGSTQKQTKSYAIISVPALKPKPFDENEVIKTI